MPRVQLPATTPKRRAWNRGKPHTVQVKGQVVQGGACGKDLCAAMAPRDGPARHDPGPTSAGTQRSETISKGERARQTIKIRLISKRSCKELRIA